MKINLQIDFFISANNLNDLNCVTTEATSVDYRLKTNLYIVLDAMWQFQAVYPAISYLLDNIEVSKYGSSVTLLSAFDGSVIVNKTFSISDFHTNYTLGRHQTCKFSLFYHPIVVLPLMLIAIQLLTYLFLQCSQE